MYSRKNVGRTKVINTFLQSIVGVIDSCWKMNHSFSRLFLLGLCGIFCSINKVATALRYNQAPLPTSCLDEKYLEPSLTSEEEFVSALEQYCLNHEALSHKLLETLADETNIGREERAEKLLELFSAYRVVNKNFKDNLELLMEQLDEKEHVKILEENQREENGEYEEELLETLEADYKVSRAAVDGIPHSELYKRMVKSIEHYVDKSVGNNIPSEVVSPMRKAMEDLRGNGVHGLLSLLYFGSEFIVPKLYSTLLQGLSSCMDLSNDEMAFLILHTGVDQEHAEEMRKILMPHCKSRQARTALARNTQHFLQARVNFYNSLIKHSPFPALSPSLLVSGGDIATREKSSSAVSKTMYNKQASNWARTQPRCLSDFTGRPVVFDFLAQEVKGKRVLDVGCGEGYCARKVIKLGASVVIGLDISEEMIDIAKSLSEDDERFQFFAANSMNLLQGIIDTLDIDQPEELFDVAMAVFLFNYLTTTEMETVIEQVHKALIPNGVFVFSVPHPSMIYCHDEDAIFRLASLGKGYFSARNQKLLGHISTIDGTELNIMSVHKTLTDYIRAIRKAGFDIQEIHEAGVTEEHMKMNPEFFGSVQDRPLHLVFKLKKL